MAKKEPTAAQLEARRKFAEAARARAAVRKAKLETAKETIEDHAPVQHLEQPDKPQETIDHGDYLALARQVMELQQMMLKGGVQSQGGVGLQNGKLLGSIEKFSLASIDYPNPVQRLFDESKLSRYALRINYDLMWRVSTVEYTTLDNVRVKEPRFTLELGRKLYNEETGEPLLDDNADQKGYIISRLTFHEDPDAALTIAREQGLDIDTTNEKAFLDELRYIRCRDWLLECFFPAPIKKTKKNEMVIGGTVVETYSITSPKSEKIPFDKIADKQLRT